MANKDFGEWAALLAEVAKDFKAAEADGKIGVEDSLLLIPIFAKLPAAIAGSSIAFKDLSAEDIKAAAVEILAAAGGLEGKAQVYVEHGFNIVSHLIAIYDDFKAIKAA